MKLFDPTSKPVDRGLTLAPRPASPRGLRLGLVENTKFNAKPILEKSPSGSAGGTRRR